MIKYYFLLVNLQNKDFILKAHSKASCGLDINPVKNNSFVSSGFDGKIILYNL